MVNPTDSPAAYGIPTSIDDIHTYVSVCCPFQQFLVGRASLQSPVNIIFRLLLPGLERDQSLATRGCIWCNILPWKYLVEDCGNSNDRLPSHLARILPPAYTSRMSTASTREIPYILAVSARWSRPLLRDKRFPELCTRYLQRSCSG